MKQVLIVLAMVQLVIGCAMFAPEPKVDVKIYKHRESGNLIYCRTGELNDEFHDYQGEGVIAESKAVEC